MALQLAVVHPLGELPHLRLDVSFGQNSTFVPMLAIIELPDLG
jgi:hypothetical protein